MGSSRRPTRRPGSTPRSSGSWRISTGARRVTWRDTLLDTKAPYGPYAARPLYGIWAAAPYLHNGSVPTLYDLLLPPERRPKTFALGGRQYDPVKARLRRETSCSQQDCLVDTARTGDGNGGHLWGTDLSEADRMAFWSISRPTDPGVTGAPGASREVGHLRRRPAVTRVPRRCTQAPESTHGQASSDRQSPSSVGRQPSVRQAVSSPGSRPPSSRACPACWRRRPRESTG